MMSARTSQANPTKSTKKNAVPSVVAATLKAKECGTCFINWWTLTQPVQQASEEDATGLRESYVASNS
jgi:hypothetical protein